MRLKKKYMTTGCLLLMTLLAGMPSSSYGEAKKDTILASQIMNADVFDSQQKRIGEVDDMIIRRSGRVKQLTVEFGGFFDIGDKLVALSFKRFNLKDGKVVLDATEKQLERKSAFSYYRHGLRPGYYYRARPYPGRYPSPEYYYSPHVAGVGNEFQDWVYSPSRFLASVFMDRLLVNEEGSYIGRVKDLLIDLNKSKVVKIILSSVEILGKDVHVALPYEPPGFSEAGIVYDIAPGELKDFVQPYEEK